MEVYGSCCRGAASQQPAKEDGGLSRPGSSTQSQSQGSEEQMMVHEKLCPSLEHSRNEALSLRPYRGGELKGDVVEFVEFVELADVRLRGVDTKRTS